MDYNSDAYKIRLNLDTMRELMRRLGNPQDNLKIVHVAGTNGKGSVIAYLSAVAAQAGIFYASYRSPALEDFKQNIQAGGVAIDEETAADLLRYIYDTADGMAAEGLSRPTRFETETALAFLYFSALNEPLVFLETGLGGRDDATNIIENPLLTILTSISLDHKEYLGESVREITEVKAGIIKAGSPVVSAVQAPEAAAVIKKVCDEKGCCLHIADGKEISVKPKSKALYQIGNSLIAAEAALRLKEQGFKIKNRHIKSGVRKAEWFGRFSVLRKTPVIILDGAHNPDGAARLKESLEKNYERRKIIFIIGIFRDKDADAIIKNTAEIASKIITVDMPENIRLLRAQELLETAKKYHNDVSASVSPFDAVKTALCAAGKKDVIVVFGSLSILAEAAKAVDELSLQT